MVGPNDHEQSNTFIAILEYCLQDKYGAYGSGLREKMAFLQASTDPNYYYVFPPEIWDSAHCLMNVRCPLSHNPNISSIKNPHDFEYHFRKVCGCLLPGWEVRVRRHTEGSVVSIQHKAIQNLRSADDYRKRKEAAEETIKRESKRARHE